MNVVILSLLLCCFVIHHSDCLSRNDGDGTSEEKLKSLPRRQTGTNNDEHPLKKNRATDEHIVIARQAGNVALNKPASQVSTYGNHGAGWAVDGRHDTVSCTFNMQVHPWWAVDLGAAYGVSHVTVTNDANTNFPYRLNNFVVGLTNANPATTAPVYKSSYTLCGQYSGSVGPAQNADVVCASSSQKYRYVIVQGSLAAPDALCLTEVSVYVSGHDPGHVPGPSRGCGNPAIQPYISMTRIINGEESRPHSWPWMCSILSCYPEGFCGGGGATLIDEYHVLTCAHAVVNNYNSRPNEIQVTCGRHNTQDSSDAGQKRAGAISIPYDGYTFGSTYDIAIVRLQEPMELSDYVQPVCLPTTPVPVGTECVTTGWGMTLGTGSSDVLRQAVLPVVDGEYQCLHDHVLCTLIPGSGTTICGGDSGGPLVCKQGDRWFQHGVTSFVFGCGSLTRPSGFANVSYYIPWIQQHTGIPAGPRK